jgi:hypothetical protein
MEPEALLPPSQVPATCPYPEPARSSRYAHNSLPENLSYYIPIYASVFQVVLSLQGSPSKPCIHPIYSTCPAHLILLDLINQIILSEKYISLSSTSCSFLCYPVTLPFLGPNILNTQFSNTPGLCSSLIVSDQVSHPQKQQAKL